MEFGNVNTQTHTTSIFSIDPIIATEYAKVLIFRLRHLSKTLPTPAVWPNVV